MACSTDHQRPSPKGIHTAIIICSYMLIVVGLILGVSKLIDVMGKETSSAGAHASTVVTPEAMPTGWFIERPLREGLGGYSVAILTETKTGRRWLLVSDARTFRMEPYDPVH